MLKQVEYQLGECYCQLDECLDKLYAKEPEDCPDCAVGDPTTTTDTTTQDGSELHTYAIAKNNTKVIKKSFS